MLLSLTILPPSLPSPLWHCSSPCLACPAIAPLLCGLSLVSPAGYSFVPPSSAPFWSGTGIASLSDHPSNNPSLFLCLSHSSRLFHMLAAAQCIHIMACIPALTFCFPLNLIWPHSCLWTRRPVYRIGTLFLFCACMHPMWLLFVCVFVCIICREIPVWGENC